MRPGPDAAGGQRGAAALRAVLLGLVLAAGGLAHAGEEAAEADGGPLAGGAELEARWIERVGDRVEGEGDVRARFGEDRATAERFTLDLDRGVLVLWEGTWSRPAGQARFARAEIDLEQGRGELLEAVVEGADGRLRLRGQALSWSGEGTLSGRALRFTTCDCEAPPWEVQARQVDVDDRAAAFRGGLLRLCGLPLLPVPVGRVALADRAAGLLPPELGWGRDGLQVGLPVYLPAGSRADLTLAPELRTARGARLLAEGRWAQPGGQGQVRLAGGWDGVEEAARGAADVDQQFADGAWRLAVQGRVEGDRSYLSDYGDAFLSRGLPWAETQAVAAWRGLRLEHDGLQALGDSPDQRQQLGGAVLRFAGQRLGPLSIDAGTRVEAVGEGPAAWQIEEDPVGRMEADLGARAGRVLGPLRVEALARSRAVRWTDGEPWLEAGGQGTAWVPGWMELGVGRLVGEVGLLGGGAAVLGEVDLRLPGDEAPPAWQVGPTATGRLVTAAGVPISAGGLLGWTPEGLRPVGWLRADRGPWSLRGSVDGPMQDARLAYADEAALLGLGVVHQEELQQLRPEAAWRLPGPLAEWRPGYAALLDLDQGAALTHGPSLAFRSRCGCLDASLAATWSADRAVPDFGFRLEVK